MSEEEQPDENGRYLLTVDEAAKFLRLGVSTVYLMVEENEIAYVRRGKSIRFRPEALEDWIHEHEQPRKRGKRIHVI